MTINKTIKKKWFNIKKNTKKNNTHPFVYPDNKPTIKPNNDGWMTNSNRMYIDYYVNDLTKKLWQDEKRDNLIIFEFGSYMGLSSNYIANKLRDSDKLYCVDLWDDGGFTISNSLKKKGQEDKVKNLKNQLYEQFLTNTWNNKKKIVPIKMDGRKAMKYLYEKNISPDLIYLDMDHEFEPVYEDLKYLLTLFPNTTIIGDDYYHYQGVKEAVCKITQEMPQYNFFANRNIFSISSSYTYLDFDKTILTTVNPNMVNKHKKYLVILHNNFKYNNNVKKHLNIDAYKKILNNAKKNDVNIDVVLFSNETIKINNNSLGTIEPCDGFLLNLLIKKYEDNVDVIVFLDINYNIIDEKNFNLYICNYYQHVMLFDYKNTIEKKKNYYNSFSINMNQFKMNKGFNNIHENYIEHFFQSFKKENNIFFMTDKLFSNVISVHNKHVKQQPLQLYDNNYLTIITTKNKSTLMHSYPMCDISFFNVLQDKQFFTDIQKNYIQQGFFNMDVIKEKEEVIIKKIIKIDERYKQLTTHSTDKLLLNINEICKLFSFEKYDISMFFSLSIIKKQINIDDLYFFFDSITSMEHKKSVIKTLNLFNNMLISTNDDNISTNLQLSNKNINNIFWYSIDKDTIVHQFDLLNQTLDKLKVGGNLILYQESIFHDNTQQIDKIHKLLKIFKQFEYIQIFKNNFPSQCNTSHIILCKNKLTTPKEHICLETLYNIYMNIVKFKHNNLDIYINLNKFMSENKTNNNLICKHFNEKKNKIMELIETKNVN
jgi:hypothetical protein